MPAEAITLVGSLIPAISGLVGVGLGGWISFRVHRQERRDARIQEKLEKFYSPLLGIWMQIRAKSETRVKVSGVAGAAWGALFEGIMLLTLLIMGAISLFMQHWPWHR